MVIITYFGHSAFKIRGKEIIVFMDPYGEEVFGRLMPKNEADIVTISHNHGDHNAIDRIEGKPFVIKEPGEYEVKDVSVLGVGTFHDGVEGGKRGKNTIFQVEIEGIRICHLGDLGHKLTEDQVEEIVGADVLLVPVGGEVTLDGKGAAEVVAQIEPKIVVPMHYRLPDTKFLLAGVEDFMEEVGEKNPEKLDVLKIEKETLGGDRKMVLLNVRT